MGTNAAVSFMLADQFDQSIDVKELIRSAKVGRADGSCHTRKCDFLDNQLRTVGDYLGTFEEFLSQIFNSISESLSLANDFSFFHFENPRQNQYSCYLYFQGRACVNF